MGSKPSASTRPENTAFPARRRRRSEQRCCSEVRPAFSYPHAAAISPTVRSVSESMRAAAASRRSIGYRCGVVEVRSRKSLAKWNLLTPASRASRVRSSGSAKCTDMYSSTRARRGSVILPWLRRSGSMLPLLRHAACSESRCVASAYANARHTGSVRRSPSHARARTSHPRRSRMPAVPGSDAHASRDVHASGHVPARRTISRPCSSLLQASAATTHVCRLAHDGNVRG